MSAPPAFQFYPGNFLASTVLLSAAATGAHVRMMCVSWDRGPIPDHQVALSKAMGLGPTDPAFADVWAEIEPKWHLTKKGWICRRLEKTRTDQAAYRERRQKAGRKGAEARYGSHSNAIATPEQSHGDAIALRSLSSSSVLDLDLPSSSLPSSSEEREREEPRALTTNIHSRPTNLVNGTDQRTHAQHGWCDPERITCVPAQLHRELMLRAKKSDAEMCAWYAEALVTWGNQPRPGNVWQFWNRLVDDWIGAALPAGAQARTGKGARTADAFARAAAKIAGHS